MYRVIIMLFVLIFCLGCTTINSISSLPREKAEPEFVVQKNVEGEIYHFDVGITLSELNLILDELSDKYPKILINTNNFTISKLSKITSDNTTYRRIVIEYYYKQIKSMHGGPYQKFVVWKNESSLLIFPKNKIWPI
jgi:hypothetical protein